MKLGFSTNAFVNKSLFYAIASIANIGYDGVEIVLDVPHAFLPLRKNKIQNIKKLVKEKNLDVSNLNVNTTVGWHGVKPIEDSFEPSLSNPNDKLRRWRIEYTKKAIDFASEIGSPSICVTSGVAKGSPMDSMQRFKESLTELSDYAEKRNILIAIEYEPGLLVGCSNDVYHFTHQKNIGLNLDTCHAAVLGEKIPSIIKKFRKKIFHTHISDCKNKKHYHLITGKGDIDFESVYYSLREINYNRYLTAELYTYANEPEKAAKETFDFLKRLVN